MYMYTTAGWYAAFALGTPNYFALDIPIIIWYQY